MINDLVWISAVDLADRTNQLPETFQYFLLRLKQYNIGIATCGTFIDGNTEPRESMSFNHVRSLLRRDYIEQEAGPLTGKALTDEIDKCLRAFVRASQRIAENLPAGTKLQDVTIRFKTPKNKS